MLSRWHLWLVLPRTCLYFAQPLARNSKQHYDAILTSGSYQKKFFLGFLCSFARLLPKVDAHKRSLVVPGFFKSGLSCEPKMTQRIFVPFILTSFELMTFSTRDIKSALATTSRATLHARQQTQVPVPGSSIAGSLAVVAVGSSYHEVYLLKMPRQESADENGDDLLELAEDGDEVLASKGLLNADLGEANDHEGFRERERQRPKASKRRSEETKTEGTDTSPTANSPQDDRQEDSESKLSGEPLKQKKSSSRRLTNPSDISRATRFSDIISVAQSVAERSVLEHLEGRRFKSAAIPRWVEAINQQCIDDLAAACGNLKYIASTIVYEASRGAGMDTFSTMFWSPANDDMVTVSWENDSVGCIVTIFGITF